MIYSNKLQTISLSISSTLLLLFALIYFLTVSGYIHTSDSLLHIAELLICSGVPISAILSFIAIVKNRWAHYQKTDKRLLVLNWILIIPFYCLVYASTFLILISSFSAETPEFIVNITLSYISTLPIACLVVLVAQIFQTVSYFKSRKLS